MEFKLSKIDGASAAVDVKRDGVILYRLIFVCYEGRSVEHYGTQRFVPIEDRQQPDVPGNILASAKAVAQKVLVDEPLRNALERGDHSLGDDILPEMLEYAELAESHPRLLN